MKILMLISIFLAFVFTGCSTHSFKLLGGDQNITKKVSNAEYKKEKAFEWKIAKGDRVEIIIKNLVPEDNDQINRIINEGGTSMLTRDGTEGYLIQNDGKVRLPVVGVISLLGLTEHEAAQKIEKKSKKYFKYPYVHVKILNQKLFVLGEVKTPGVVQVTNGTMSLFEALAHTGDLTDDADRTNIKIVRGDLRNPEIREINLADISDIKMTSLILRPNDIIYVQPRGMKAYNVAFREVTPFFNMLTQIMAPFVLFDTLANTRVINVITK